MNSLKFSVILLFLAVSLYSCKKEKETQTTPAPIVGKYLVDSLVFKDTWFSMTTFSIGHSMNFRNDGKVEIKEPLAGVNMVVPYQINNNILITETDTIIGEKEYLINFKGNRTILHHQDSTYSIRYYLRK